MELSREDYSKHYVTEALFKLMESRPFNEIPVSDVAKKAGVGRATFYRYFSCKEDVIKYFLDRTCAEFSSEQVYRPRSPEDYEDIIKRVVRYIKEHKQRLKLICKAHLEYIYFNYVDASLLNLLKAEMDDDNEYKAAGFAGAIANITLHWVMNDCKDDESVVFDAFRTVALGDKNKF